MSEDSYTCDRCGFAWAPAEERRHRRLHDELDNRVILRPSKYDRKIFRDHQIQIVMINGKSSTNQKDRAYRVASLVQTAMDYDFPSFTRWEKPGLYNPTVFLAIDGDRAIGYAIFRNKPASGPVSWRKRCYKLSAERRWVVDLIWICENRRREGVATKLVAEGTKYLSTSPRQVAWSTPMTSDGYKLAKAMSPQRAFFSDACMPGPQC